MILIYILENISVLVLRESRAQWYKPEYRSPFYPSLQIFGIISCSALLFGMGELALYAIASIAIPGIILYAGYSRNKTTRKGVVGIRGKRVDLIDEQPQDSGFCRFDVNGDAEVVVSLFGHERSPEMLVEMAISLAEHKRVEVADILEIPEQTDIHDFVDEPANMRSLRRRIHAMAEDKNESITYDPIISHDVAKTVFEISQRLHCNWLVLEWGGRSRGTFTIHSPVGWLKSHLYCNLATFRDAGVRYIRKIMVYIEKDNNVQLILETADHLAEVHNARVCITFYNSEQHSDESTYSCQSYLKELASKQKIEPSTKVLTGDNKVQVILQETCDYDLFILGSSKQTLIKSITGTLKDKLIAKASCSVLAVHKSSNI